MEREGPVDAGAENPKLTQTQARLEARKDLPHHADSATGFGIAGAELSEGLLLLDGTAAKQDDILIAEAEEPKRGRKGGGFIRVRDAESRQVVFVSKARRLWPPALSVPLIGRGGEVPDEAVEVCIGLVSSVREETVEFGHVAAVQPHRVQPGSASEEGRHNIEP